MIRIRLVLFALVAFAVTSGRTQTNNSPDFNEVLGLVREHLSGTTDAEMNRIALDGLLSALRGKVSIVEDKASATSTNPPLAKSTLLENDIAYLRIARFDSSLATDCATAIAKMGVSNKLIGVVLDLRFAEGDDYAAAAAVADLFQSKAQPLIDWGSGKASSKAKSDAIKMPVGILVNSETGGAGEALAAIMRETGAGLILGTPTSGRAMIADVFPLKTGQKLRIATKPVTIGNGVALTTRGLKPDIEVALNGEDERALVDDPYGLTIKTASLNGLSGTNQLSGTNRPVRRPRPNEADLVRARKDGISLDGDLPEPRKPEPVKPLLRDPALARAVDLLKGLAVVRSTRSE